MPNNHLRFVYMARITSPRNSQLNLVSEKIIPAVCLLASLTVLTATLVGYLARWVNLAEFVVSLRPLIFLTGVALLAISLLIQQKQPLLITLLSLTLNGVEFAPYLLPVKPAPNSDLKLLFYNVDKNHLPTAGTDAVIRLVLETEPDVAVLREVGVSQAAEFLAALTPQYPYSLDFQHVKKDGFLILSRYPLVNKEITQLGGGRQVGLADVLINGRSIHLVAPHPTNALHGIEERNQQLTAIADYVESAPRPLVVAGDLNVTMWSGWYKGIERAGVRNVRIGNGIMPSWKIPGAVFPETLIYIPLDHILVSEEIAVFSADILPSTGSDHQPLLAELDLP